MKKCTHFWGGPRLINLENNRALEEEWETEEKEYTYLFTYYYSFFTTERDKFLLFIFHNAPKKPLSQIKVFMHEMKMYV